MLWHAMKLGVVTTKAFLEKSCNLGPCSIHIDGLELVYEALGHRRWKVRQRKTDVMEI